MKFFVKSIRPCLLIVLLGLVFASNSFSQQTVYWRDTAVNGNWANVNDNNWYRSNDGWDVRRPDLAFNQWATTGTRSYNIIIFGNGTQSTTTVNNEGSADYWVHQLLLSNSTSRTFNSSGGGYLKMGGGSGNAKIESISGAGTGTYTFNVSLSLDKATELNAVGGDITFGSSGTITNNGNTVISYTSSGRTLTLGGIISGSGGFEHKGAGLVILDAANTYTGATTVEASGGKIQIKNAAALGGTGGATTVSTGAALEIFNSLGSNIGETLTLSGDGISGAGALRNLTGDNT